MCVHGKSGTEGGGQNAIKAREESGKRKGGGIKWTRCRVGFFFSLSFFPTKDSKRPRL